MFIVRYDPVNGSAYADIVVEATVRAAWKRHDHVEPGGGNSFLNAAGNIELVTSTELLQTAARVMVNEGVIPVDGVRFEYVDPDGEVIVLYHDKNGRVECWPDPKTDVLSDLLMRLI